MKASVRALGAAAVAAALLLGGCGQKGPLYLPEKKGAVVTSPAQSSAPVPAPSGQPPVRSPAPQPQSTPEPASPSGTATPAKKTNQDDDQTPK